MATTAGTASYNGCYRLSTVTVKFLLLCGATSDKATF